MIDISKFTYGRLKPLKFVYRSGTSYYWLVKCECGSETIISKSNMSRGQSECGRCSRKTSGKKRVVNHSFGHELKSTYYAMIYRCTSPLDRSFSRYGGRGIKVCEEWSDKEKGFKSFVNSMGNRPKGYTLDRIDVNGDYEPENCRWASRYTQNTNKQKQPRNVCFSGRKWAAYIVRDYKKHHLGTYNTESQALTASASAAEMYSQGITLTEIKKELKERIK